ncbi:MAG: hypothetical protein KGL39_55215 [Patescibacteria group bacterium]|nr:hypothetical protein [Patescibacteria group bacterium]
MSYCTDVGLLRDDSHDIDGPADGGAWQSSEYDYGAPGTGPRCTCGWDAALHDAELYDYEIDRAAFAGCAGCDPVDFECKPYGFGIELFEDAARLAVGWDCRYGQWRGGPYQRVPMAHEECVQRIEAATSIDRDLLRRSDRAWGHICDAAESHGQAVARYERWIKAKLARS